MRTKMLVNLILLIAGTNGGGCHVQVKPREWVQKRISYGAYEDPSRGTPTARLPGKANLYEILDENVQDHEDKLVMQMHIYHNKCNHDELWGKDLEELQKLMQERKYEKIVRLLRRANLVNEKWLSSRNSSNRDYWRRHKDLFWSDGNRTFSEAVLRWILLRVKNDLKSEIFLFAAKADLPSVCREIPEQLSQKVAQGHTDESCPICYEKMKERGVVTPCRHEFHGECLSKWVDKHGSCPYCRAELPLQPTPFFIKAVKANSPNCTGIIMKKMSDFDVDIAEKEINALQYITVRTGDWGEMCEALLQNGMQPLIEKRLTNAYDQIMQRTPLMRAIWKRNPNVVRCLIRHGANLQASVLFPEDGAREITPLTSAYMRMVHTSADKSKELKRKSQEVYRILQDSKAKN